MPVTPASVSAVVAETLARSASDVFGVMGNGNAYFLDALLACGMRFTAMRHEAGGVAAADAYYRASGRLAVATATYGAGLTNCATALAEAVMAGIPLVLVVGAAPTHGPRPWDIDQTAFATSVGARTFVVGIDDPAAVTSRAVAHALHARTGVVLAIPYDVAAAPAKEGEVSFAPAPAPPVEPDGNALDDVAALLTGAERPLLLAGRGAWLAGAGEALGVLAADVGALTATTALAQGLFSDSRYDLGVAGGFGQEQAMALAGTADVVLVVGAALNQFTTRFGGLFASGARVVQVDIRDAASHPAVTDFVRGDALLAAKGIADRVHGLPRSRRAWRDSVPELFTGATRDRDPGTGTAGDGRLDPRTLAMRLGRLLPQDRIVVSDGGHFIGWANTYWPVAAPDRMIMVGTAFQTIGLGLPSAVGAARARPDSTIVVTTGDGGALMALADLESVVRAVRHGVIVLWNDAAYGAEVHMYGRWGLDPGPMLIPETDFAALARAVGARSAVVRGIDDLKALQEWLDAGEEGVFLVDARVSRVVVAPYQEEIVSAASRR